MNLEKPDQNITPRPLEWRVRRRGKLKMVKVRAKSIIKLDTGKSSLDYVYLADTSVEELAKDILHAVVQNKGTAQTKSFVDEILCRYEPDYKGV